MADRHVFMTELAQPAAAGLAAFQAGKMAQAYSLLTQARDAGDKSDAVLIALAIAARDTGHADDCLDAAQTLLSSQPGNLEAIILKADAFAAKGDERKAASHYLTAVKAAPPPGQITGRLATELERARQACAQAAVRYEEFLRSQVKSLGLFDGSGRARGEQAMDVLFGRKQIYYQQPEKFYFPELPQIQFYDPADFPWTKDLIAQTDVVKAELEAILQAGGEGFEPYVPAKSETPHLRDNSLMGNADWGAFHLIKDGVQIEENAKHCPATLKALSLAPMPQVRGKSPVALFSRLRPGAHIPPHTGLMNTRIICHLPVIAPEGCALRVGNQERSWRMGEMLIFDDSIEHEARNASGADRVVLLFDIWRPELSEDERGFVSAVFEAIEEFGVF